MTTIYPTDASTVGHIPLVEVTRGPIVESVHFGSYTVVTPDGSVLTEAGAPDVATYARSALKPLQAVAMVRAGLDLPDRLLALSAASHSGSELHRDGALEILTMHGSDANALRNVRDLPYGADERVAFLHAGGEPSQLAQNCSGKHAAMVATCLINGWSTRDYLDVDHPLQQLVQVTISELTGEEASAVTIDGCGTPLFAYSLRAIARAYARLATAAEGSPEKRVVNAMRTFPEMVAGEQRDVTTMMRAVPGFVAKEGAESIQLGGLTEAGVGIAVKISDGGDRARLAITASILGALGLEGDVLAQLRSPAVLGGGAPVGGLRTVDAVTEALSALHAGRS